MCRVMKVSRAGFYSWLGREESERSRQRRAFDMAVKTVFDASKGRSGSEKLANALSKKGTPCRRQKVSQSMKRQGLRSKVRKKFRVTTDSKHSEPVAPNILNRQFTVSEPNRVWVSDITYIRTRSGWAYLTVFLDLFSRLVVGWSVSTSLSHEMVLQALQRAVWRRRPGKGLLIHSDRGIQYACKEFRKFVREAGFVQSMSRKGNCWDNAVAESFFRTLKTELIYHVDLDNLTETERELFEYLESFYNGQRLHATLGYMSPMEYETVMLKSQMVA